MNIKNSLKIFFVLVSISTFTFSARAELAAADREKVSLKTVDVYTKLAEMDPCYRGEEDSPPHPTCLFHHDFTVRYFREENEQDRQDREKYRVIFINGLARRAVSPEAVMSDNGKMNYVLDAKGNFYIFNEKKTKEIRHSSFFAGGKVASAGDMKMQDGKITEIDGDSGHYQMNDEILKNVLDYLKSQGVVIEPKGTNNY